MQPQRQQKATLHDVAARVGVSPRTVSRVVNNEGGFSAKTRTRVMDAISELDYRPNLLARSLVTNRSNTVALIVPVIDDPFFPELAHGVQLAARDLGLNMYLAVTDDDLELQDELLSRMASQAIDGAILFPATDAPEAPLRYADQGLSIVTVDSLVEHPNICCVRSDLERGVELAVEHLHATGRRNIAMLANSSRAAHSRRVTTFRSLQGDGAVVIESNATYDGGYQAMNEILEHHRSVDGIFAYNDLMGIGAIAAALDAGAQVPEHYAVVGCDDIDMSARVSPGLTTIRLDRERLGAEAVAKLVELTSTGISPEPVTLPVSLVVREST